MYSKYFNKIFILLNVSTIFGHLKALRNSKITLALLLQNTPKRNYFRDSRVILIQNRFTNTSQIPFTKDHNDARQNTRGTNEIPTERKTFRHETLEEPPLCVTKRVENSERERVWGGKREVMTESLSNSFAFNSQAHTCVKCLRRLQ